MFALCLIAALGGSAAVPVRAEGPGTPEPAVFTLRAPESANDLRNAYVADAIRLALDKTVASHGPYRIERAAAMNKRRALVTAQQRQYPNFLVVAGVEDTHEDARLLAVRFPLMLGVVGYRVCFVAPGKEAAVARASSLDELRRFHIGQGSGWKDVSILVANGFQVLEVSRYENLFAMVSKGRVDLFCRSVLELPHELQRRREMKDLRLDRSFALVYELPQFIYTHQSDRAGALRLEQGLQAAYKDGSLQALLRRHLRPSLDLLEMGKRRLYRLESPPPPNLGFDYRQYDLDLMREATR